MRGLGMMIIGCGMGGSGGGAFGCGYTSLDSHAVCNIARYSKLNYSIQVVASDDEVVGDMVDVDIKQ
jgi:hypothetical protein